MQELFVVRLKTWDRARAFATADFQIKKEVLPQLGRDRDLYHHMPIAELKLKNEELIVKKVKRRPGLLVIREGLSPKKLAIFLAGLVNRPNPTEQVFAPIVIMSARIIRMNSLKVKSGELPEFIYLPAHGATSVANISIFASSWRRNMEMSWVFRICI